MEKGNWIPMDKSLTAALPVKRPYTLIEAVFSYQVDMDNGIIRGFRDYARIWGWSKNKVIGFIRDKQGTKTDQPKDTHGTVKFRFIKPRQECKGQAKDTHRPSRGQAEATTIDPNPNKKNYSPEILGLSNLLADKIIENNPRNRSLNGKRGKTILVWAKDIEKLYRIDQQTLEDIGTVIEWSQRDAFWKTNILSGDSLRKNWDKLLPKAKATGTFPQQTKGTGRDMVALMQKHKAENGRH